MAEKKIPKPKPPEKSQRERFIEFAREHGADDPDALDHALGKDAENLRAPKKDD